MQETYPIADNLNCAQENRPSESFARECHRWMMGKKLAKEKDNRGDRRRKRHAIEKPRLVKVGENDTEEDSLRYVISFGSNHLQLGTLLAALPICRCPPITKLAWTVIKELQVRVGLRIVRMLG